jgi:hypothetical protein
MKRHDIINSLIAKFNYENYLEIGTQAFVNFNKVQILNKVCIEPFPNPHFNPKLYTFIGTSDEYFKTINKNTLFDIVFIDGDHTKEQVLKDIENSLNHLSENGTIVCHDCLPSTELMQSKQMVKGLWTGDVWKGIAKLRIERADLDIKVVDTDMGCGIIRRGINVPHEPKEDWENYSYFQNNKKEMMNVITTKEFAEWI